MNVLVWYENRPLPEAVQAEARIYPRGIHGALADLFDAQDDMCVRTAVMQDPQQGFSDENLAWADVLVYFGHKHWREVADDRVDLIQRACAGRHGADSSALFPCQQNFFPPDGHTHAMPALARE